MAQTAGNVIDKAKYILQEEATAVHWTDAELLAWLNAGMREVVRLKPDANPNIQTVALASGVMQSLPTGAVLLLDVNCNMGTDGATVGTGIPVVERVLMDKILPGWRTVTAATTVINVIYDALRLPKKFAVYPQSTGTNYIEIITADLPDDILVGADLTIGDEYSLALVHFILYMCMLKDADFVLSEQRADTHHDLFLQDLGIFTQNTRKEYPIKKGSDDE